MNQEKWNEKFSEQMEAIGYSGCTKNTYGSCIKLFLEKLGNPGRKVHTRACQKNETGLVEKNQCLLFRATKNLFTLPCEKGSFLYRLISHFWINLVTLLSSRGVTKNKRSTAKNILIIKKISIFCGMVNGSPNKKTP